MKTYVFSIGEKTTDLCCELLTKYGLEVILFKSDSTLWDKLKEFYINALESEDDTFMRVDADIIPNKNVFKLLENHNKHPRWTCAVGFDWYKQDQGSISIHLMDRQVIYKCLEHIMEAKDKVRPETYLWRLPEVNSLTYTDESILCGVHGYGQKDHRQRIKDLKHTRGQRYNWDLLERIEAL